MIDSAALLEGSRPRLKSRDAAADPQDPPRYLRSPRSFIMHYLASWRWHFIFLAVLVVVAGCSAVGVQYAMKLLVDGMAAGPGDHIGLVWTALATFIVLIAAESLLWRASGWLGCRATIGVGVDMRLDLFDHLSGQPMRYFTENLAGSLGQRITATAGNFGALSNTLVWRITPPTIDFLGALVVFATINGQMALVLGVYVVAVTVGLILFGERGRPMHQAFAGRAAETAGGLTDVISNMWAVKAFSARKRERQRLAGSFAVESRLQRRSWMFLEKTRLLYDILLWGMVSGMLSWALYLWSRGAITTGDVVIVSTLTFRILHGTRDLSLALVDVGQQFGFIQDTLKLIGQRPSLVDDPRHRVLHRGGGSVEFRKAGFTYGGPGREAVHELSLFIRPGEEVGIVGPSGAGKSTLISLIQRLYDVQSGDVLIDGQSVTSITQDSLRDALAVVPQEISLFHRSVMENIRFGRPDASDEEVYAAARAACCDGFIRSLPEGYDTMVGERGAKLSGGQRQRIGIARAFLKNAPIIILDEATSALDTESEMAIQHSLVDLMQERTVIAVAHRLSTVAAFDRVLVMQGGRIVEEGPAHELRRRGGLFTRMWRLQAEGLPIEGAEPLGYASAGQERAA
ncbi:MAG TPA: ABC transporter ATP-binding protein [Geminicoccus sp.]|uniref:ABC transporter ATP-binding protein n=1 Tax=Geminicoccus sp. TaxID=2024832 RepID=UPI002B69735F|nr:ABC transporter ATP-binding protein [Geminicoccus sp.]HWL70020.1 ABC transporter ATP-binding protein [Geminicoccus sp.]